MLIPLLTNTPDTKEPELGIEMVRGNAGHDLEG